jgi:hypothetical protein
VAALVARAGFEAHYLSQHHHRHRDNRDHAKQTEDYPYGAVRASHDQNPIRANATQAAPATGNPIAIETSESLIHLMSIEISHQTGEMERCL